MDDPTFGGTSEKNRKLRQAISLSIDSREIIDLLHQGLGVPAEFMVAPGLFGYEPEYKMIGTWHQRANTSFFRAV